MKRFWNLAEPQLLFDDENVGGSGNPMNDIISASLDDAGIREAEPQAETIPETKVEAEGEPDEEAELKALELDLKAKTPTLRGNIDVARHQAVLTRARNLHQKELEAAKAEAQQLAWAKDPEVQATLQAMQLAGTDRKAFVELLLRDPEYANLIDWKQLKKEAVAEVKAQASSTRPGPNAKTPDGTQEYYDDKGLQALLDWHTQQASEKAKTEALAVVEAKYGKIAEKFELEGIWNQALEAGKGQLEQARANWPQFKENEAAIKDCLAKNPKYGLSEAYRDTVMTKMASEGKVNKEKMRRELLAEINGKAAAAGSVKPGSGVEKTSASNTVRSNEDIIREAIRGLQ